MTMPLYRSVYTIIKSFPKSSTNLIYNCRTFLFITWPIILREINLALPIQKLENKHIL